MAICVTVADGAEALPDAIKTKATTNGSAPIDYKHVLSDTEFTVFAGLRRWRKLAAEQAGQPVYALFTNEQLAQIAQRNVRTLTALGEIDGIGPARLERYGQAVLECMAGLEAGAQQVGNVPRAT